MNASVDTRRTRILKSGTPGNGPVIYWMQRDQRVRDNWALLHAQDLAMEHRSPLAVIFVLSPLFPKQSGRQYHFMVEGLRQVADALASRNIPFFVLNSEPGDSIREFARLHQVSTIVTDFSPLREVREWMATAVRSVSSDVIEVDAHNIVPCWIASPKQEFAAYTFRPKMRKLLPGFETQFPAVIAHPYPWNETVSKPQWQDILGGAGERSGELGLLKAGEDAALTSLENFLENRLSEYDLLRNDPTKNGQSDLSPYLHFGQLSAQRIAMEVRRLERNHAGSESFLEELIVRRELSDNYCLYNPAYDSVEGFPSWARLSLDEHRNDPREYCYTSGQFERAETHDDLWNAAQREMVRTGKMHGYMRMYWAKKILEWSPAPEDAQHIAIDLNDRYELDGRDPNGYAGIAWSIGGVHDRAWFDRPVFGKIRYMNRNGCKSKFDVDAYIARNRE